ncbi:MAG: YdeI family protein [Candidatus Dormibacteria bacterium]
MYGGAVPGDALPRGGSELSSLCFASAAAWREWLEGHGAESPGVWLRLAKKGSGVTTVTYSDALDVALCFGWIDGQKGALDGRYWLQRFTRRGARSRWSKINRDRADALLAAGLMTPAGRAEIDRARADGRWDAAYSGQRTATVPDDLQVALDANPKAQGFFARLSGAGRYAILYRIDEAKRPETRARRIERFVAMLAAGEAPHSLSDARPRQRQTP